MVCEALSTLQEKSKSIPFKKIERILAREYDDLYNQVFLRVQAEPLGTGAIAQVHRADILLDGKVSPVAVKVVRPGVQNTIEIDLLILRVGAWMIDAIMPGARWLSLPEEVQIFSAMMHDQLDMRREAQNLSQFRSNFQQSTEVSFPVPILSLTRQNVLVESFENALPISSILNIDKQVHDHKIADMLLHMFLVWAFLVFVF